MRGIEDIFHAVLAVPEDQRAQELEARCAGDVQLLSELRSLIDASEAEERLGARRAASARTPGAGALQARLIGPYRLERLLGRGGMGAVYLARRADGHFDQQVAIKLIDLPLATDLFRERFRFERQILAGLAHPFIARLLDGGVTEDGEPYLAMEYVEGVSITRYCEQHRLSLRDRLMLFAKVCGAVQFAHQNLVVHRDLKPDNILVAADGAPRLLDFGTAKLLIPPTGAAPGFTQHGIQSFTPQYASPEQVLGEPITTACDTYSLGVLLYVLLAGVPPYTMLEFTTAEMLRVICSQRPVKPSSAVAPPDRPTLAIDADLDAIVLKALRKEPHQRYPTVEQLEADIHAWLGGQPVLARRGTWRYRAGKFIRRNKVPLAAAALLVVSVAGGVAGVMSQSRAANRQRQRAEARSEDLRQLSNSLLSEIDDAIKELPGSTPVQRLLVQRVLDHLDRMSRDAAGDRFTQLDLINAYTRLGNLQGNPYDQNIGDPSGALTSLGKALGIAGSLAAASSKDPVTLAATARAQQSRGEVLFGIGRTPEAIVSMRAAVAAFDACAAASGATADQMADAASAAGALGDQLGPGGVAGLGDTAGALAAYRQSLELSHQALAREPGFTRSLRSVAVSRIKIGNILMETDPWAALAEYRQSAAAWQALPAADRSAVSIRRGAAMTQLKIALALAEIRDYALSLDVLEKARSTYEYYAAADATDVRASNDLAVYLQDDALIRMDLLNPALNPEGGDRREITRQAIDRLQRVVAIHQRLVSTNAQNRGWAANLLYEKALLGSLQQSVGAQRRGAQVTPLELAALKSSASLPGASNDVLDVATSVMLTVLPGRLRDTHWTVGNAERLVSLTHRRIPDHLLSLAQAYRLDGRPDASVATAREALALLAGVPAGSKMPRLRKLLTLEAERH